MSETPGARFLTRSVLSWELQCAVGLGGRWQEATLSHKLILLGNWTMQGCCSSADSAPNWKDDKKTCVESEFSSCFVCRVNAGESSRWGVVHSRGALDICPSRWSWFLGFYPLFNSSVPCRPKPPVSHTQVLFQPTALWSSTSLLCIAKTWEEPRQDAVRAGGKQMNRSWCFFFFWW